jgi:hypothetical protein
MTPEEKTREKIDALLGASGWVVQTREQINLSFAKGESDYTLFVGGKAMRRAQANLKRYRAAVLKVGCEGQLVAMESELHCKRKTKSAKFEIGFGLGNGICKKDNSMTDAAAWNQMGPPPVFGPYGNRIKRNDKCPCVYSLTSSHACWRRSGFQARTSSRSLGNEMYSN